VIVRTLWSVPPRPVRQYTNCTPVQADTEQFVSVHPAQKRLGYAGLWTLANFLEPSVPPLQGGGRWFKSSIAHLEKAEVCRINADEKKQSRYLPVPSDDNPALRLGGAILYLTHQVPDICPAFGHSDDQQYWLKDKECHGEDGKNRPFVAAIWTSLAVARSCPAHETAWDFDSFLALRRVVDSLNRTPAIANVPPKSCTAKTDSPSARANSSPITGMRFM
jgi:hypothetical protein